MNKFLQNFSFLNEFLKLMSKHEPLPVDVINCDGGRKSGKSVSFAIFLSKAMTTIDPETGDYIKASAIVIKKKANTLDDVYREYTKWALNEEIKPKTIKSKYMWDYERGSDPDNKNYVLFKPWIDTHGQTLSTQGGGWSSLDGEYVFVIIEECYEITALDRQSIMEAVRSSNDKAKMLIINICNPWQPLNPYIRFSGSHLKYDVYKLKKTGFMYKICEVNELAEMGIQDNEFKPTKNLFIHCNWRSNELIKNNQYQINLIKQAWKLTPQRAPAADYGIPGYNDNACYGDYLQNVKEAVYEPKKYFLCGGDEGLGGKASGKTSFVFGGYNDGGFLDIYDLYVWDNKISTKTAVQIADEVIEFFVKNKSEFENNTNQVIDFIEVRVDKCAIAFINELNNRAELNGIDWINFVSCSKYKINDRVVVVRSLLDSGKFRVNSIKCAPLLEEMSKAEWNDQVQTDTNMKRKDRDDHSINAMEYGIEPVMYDMCEIDIKRLLY